jgi:hypothetical protein
MKWISLIPLGVIYVWGCDMLPTPSPHTHTSRGVRQDVKKDSWNCDRLMNGSSSENFSNFLAGLSWFCLRGLSWICLWGLSWILGFLAGLFWIRLRIILDWITVGATTNWIFWIVYEMFWYFDVLMAVWMCWCFDVLRVDVVMFWCWCFDVLTEEFRSFALFQVLEL